MGSCDSAWILGGKNGPGRWKFALALRFYGYDEKEERIKKMNDKFEGERKSKRLFNSTCDEKGLVGQTLCSLSPLLKREPKNICVC